MNGHDLQGVKDLFEQYKQHSDEWRYSINEKIGKIFDKLNELPCKERAVITDNNEKMHIYIWSAILFIFSTIGGALLSHLLGKL